MLSPWRRIHVSKRGAAYDLLRARVARGVARPRLCERLAAAEAGLEQRRVDAACTHDDCWCSWKNAAQIPSNDGADYRPRRSRWRGLQRTSSADGVRNADVARRERPSASGGPGSPAMAASPLHASTHSTPLSPPARRSSRHWLNSIMWKLPPSSQPPPMTRLSSTCPATTLPAESSGYNQKEPSSR